MRREDRLRGYPEREYGGREYLPAEPIPDPWGGLYPPVSWGGGAVYGLEGGGPSPFAIYGPSPYDEAYDTRLPPDEALRRERLTRERRGGGVRGRGRVRGGGRAHRHGLNYGR